MRQEERHLKQRIWAIALACVLSLTTGAYGGKGLVSQDPPNPADEQLLDEGTDTACAVEYRAYSGAHASMFLSEGDRIAVISPSTFPTRAQTDAVIQGLKAWGYEPVEGKHVCADTRTLEDVLEDLIWALEDPEIRAIFCVRGGYGASEATDCLPKDLVEGCGKLIIGYSDITAYHSLWTASELPSIHASMSAAFGEFPESCREAEKNILKGMIPAYTCKSSGCGQPGQAKGVLIGGNLSTFTAVIGTAYNCTKAGRPYILFLEDVGEDMQHIHRYLTVLKHAGVLGNAAGIVFGEWTELPVSMSDYDGSSRGGTFRSVADMISRQFLPDIDAPVAFGFPAGHGDVNYPLLMGEMAELRVDPDGFTLICGAGE